MITSSDTYDYSSLWAAADKELNLTGDDTIKSLEQYFHYLPELVEKAVDKGRYLRLPLNEPYFIIDTNTRKIIIPPEFEAAGVGVVGDQVAEILYFEVDRYFDITDLDQTTIYIQWTNPAGDSGLSLGLLKKTTDEKVVFGWALDDEIMKSHDDANNNNKGGNIEFAIRFINIDDNNEIIYSLSTEPIKVKMNSSLNFNITEFNAPEDLTNMLIGRLTKSQITNIVDPAGKPIFFDGWNITNYTTDLINGKYTMETQAYSPDSGSIKYALYRNGEKQTDFSVGLPKLTDDEIPLANKKYYQMDESGELIQIDNPDIPEENGTIYEVRGSYELNKAGQYLIKVRNIKKQTNYAEIDTGIITIPSPNTPIIKDLITVYQLDEIGNTTLNVTAEINDNGELSYQWQKKDKLSGNYLNIDGAVNSSYETNIGEAYYQVQIANTHNNETVIITTQPIHVIEHVQSPIISYQNNETIFEEGTKNVEITVGNFNELKGIVIAEIYRYNELYGTPIQMNSETLSIPNLPSAVYKIKLIHQREGFEASVESNEWRISTVLS